MTSWPAPTRSDHESFCQKEGWVRVRGSQGRTGTHHITYEFEHPDGRTLRTRISHPPDRTSYGPSMWSHILTEQLVVTEAELWACVQRGELPVRGKLAPPTAAIPAQLVWQLIHNVGIDEKEVRVMSKDEAIERLSACWASSTNERQERRKW
jgi:hypothetical protein